MSKIIMNKSRLITAQYTKKRKIRINLTVQNPVMSVCTYKKVNNKACMTCAYACTLPNLFIILYECF